jgi:hypothetical protein
MQVDAVKRAAMCNIGDTKILVVDGKGNYNEMQKALGDIMGEFNIDKLLLQEIPLDKRHNAKVDYPALIKSLNSIEI